MSTHKAILIWMIIYQILVVILTLSWLAVTFVPNIMMFDAGITAKAIGIDVMMTLTPIAIWWLGTGFGWYWYKRQQFKRCLLATTTPLILTALAAIVLSG